MKVLGVAVDEVTNRLPELRLAAAVAGQHVFVEVSEEGGGFMLGLGNSGGASVGDKLIHGVSQGEIMQQGLKSPQSGVRCERQVALTANLGKQGIQLIIFR